MRKSTKNVMVVQELMMDFVIPFILIAIKYQYIKYFRLFP